MPEKNLTPSVRDSAWLGGRARNAARRPIFTRTVIVSVVLLAILSLVLAPKNRSSPGPSASAATALTDTDALAHALAQAQSRVISADSALVVVRQRVVAAAARPRIDSLDPKMIRRHDSLTNVLTDLQSLIAKVETAPLPTSYRALASSSVLLSDPRIIALLDSLRDVEHDRDDLGATGGADPTFVALTTRATELGHAIEAIANQRRDSLLAAITRMTAPSAEVVETRAIPADTMRWVAEGDLARAALTAAVADIASARRQQLQIIEDKKRAQEISVLSASPFAMIVAALTLAIVLGFAVGLRSECLRPTVASGAEVERLSGARIIATVIPMTQRIRRERRQANRVAPKYLDFKGDSYRLAYLHVERSVATPDVVAIIGDDADVCAIVAINLAAIAVEDARSVLVIDAAGRSAAIQSLLPMSGSRDLAEVISGQVSWSDATTHISVGRDKTIDVVTGVRPAEPGSVIDLLRRDNPQLRSLYDTVFVVASLDLGPQLAADDSVGGTVIAATVARTTLDAVVQTARMLRENERPVFGAILWDGAPPNLAARPKRRGGGDRKPQAGARPEDVAVRA